MIIQACPLDRYDRFGFGSDEYPNKNNNGDENEGGDVRYLLSKEWDEYESFLLEALESENEDGDGNENECELTSDSYRNRNCWSDRDIYEIYNKAEQEDCYWLEMSYYSF